ncbi:MULTISPECIES: lysophospholipid acyltransferase family protein [unclassified Sphingomonas]|uniref:lysophospholipid acyltransferase family protein n=1 Tax=unclassified Sphingomonas TaxID=196159 RepID=UPI0007023131|nr:MULTISPECIES: lysophospholipid acyltransferase family protein [unclassified Sphingomonas]KQM26437.1 glycerol acyltransferase [Sphingomonas sp. Leaf9]KQM42846.1 glycerol acyltransferase [Sphingomonas sp. Leaf11]KQM87170.1 glycerol acyltransferase [Sphingomonas sp. Leaf23]
MAWVRTLIFRILFYAASVPIVLSAPLSARFGQRAMHVHAHVWIRTHRFLARWILGVRVRVEGQRPPGTYLFAVKHQAMFETLEMAQRIDGPLIVMKRELIDMPFWGRTAKAYGAIGVDRDASSKALRQMLKEAAVARAANRSVLIFPEGTRVEVGEAPPLRSGFAGLYKALNMPVVPVALDSGHCMPRKGASRPGVITIRFLDPIPAGLPREEIEARVHAAINVLEPAAGGVAGSLAAE